MGLPFSTCTLIPTEEAELGITFQEGSPLMGSEASSGAWPKGAGRPWDRTKVVLARWVEAAGQPSFILPQLVHT